MARLSKLFLNIMGIFLLYEVEQSHSKEAFFTEVAKELRCSGCDLTVKVLDQMLFNINKTDGIEHQIDRVLDVVCDEKRFSISEYKPATMVKVCKFMKEYHRGELRKELIYHYSQPKKPTYLELSQHLCLDVIRLCPGISHKNDHHTDHTDTKLHMDADHDFTVVPGKNVKSPKPVSAHEEL